MIPHSATTTHSDLATDLVSGSVGLMTLVGSYIAGDHPMLQGIAAIIAPLALVLSAVASISVIAKNHLTK